MRRIILAGGSGFLGSSLRPFLAAHGYEVVVFSRSPGSMESGTKAIEWDGRTVGPWCDALEDATAVVNLTGKSVNCRYTQKNRLEILRSRVDSVRVLGEAISRLARPPGVLVQASSLAIYGDAGDTVCTEQSPPGDDFGAQVCVEWEATLNSLKLPATRIVALRIAFALGEGGGALGALAGLTKCCLGGAAGTGSQYISWIHVDDLSKMFLWSIERAELAGVFNATSSFPVTNREFMAELRRALGRPWSPPVPSWAVKLGSFLMRTESSLILKGRRCRAERFLQSGFEFRFPKLDQALRSLFRK